MLEKFCFRLAGLGAKLSPTKETAPVAYQFIHIEQYGRQGAHKKKSSARKRSMYDIRDEMIRAPRACPHVADPKPPVILFGKTPNEAIAIAAERAATAVDKIGRKLRCDSPVVVIGVASWPELVSDVIADPEKRAEYARWRAKTIAWLKARWGDDLESVVQHMDEPRPHIHFVVVPKLDDARRLQIQSVHPGERAAAECKNAGDSPSRQRAAYVDAMIDLQGDYYDKVSACCGLTRLGPHRQRLTRKEWVQQQRQAEAMAEASAKLERREDEVMARATQFVNDRIAAADVEAQKKFKVAAQKSAERFETLKRKANEDVTVERQRVVKLEMQLSAKDAVIAAQEEQLKSLQATLEALGIEQGMTM